MAVIGAVRSESASEIRRARMLIDGNWVESASGEVLPVENPARRQIIAEIPRGSAADVDRAVTAASVAFPGWAQMPPRERGRMLLRIGEVLESRAEAMARTIALETGNALRTQARGEARLAAEGAPLGVLLTAEICHEHLPKGVLNVLTGLGEECGAPLTRHPSVRKLSFTGSTEVGKLVMGAAAERIVPVSLELGGKSPSIVFPDANEDWVVDGIAAMRFTRQSQSCTAGSRLFLHADIFDAFLDRLREKTAALKIGDPLDESDRHRRDHQREAIR